jgi:penicillin amidase
LTSIVELRDPKDKAAVWRDRWGIAHVRAKSTGDAFFAQGFVHAQGRLWQMDAARRRMLGRFAEWEGPAGVAADILARQLDAAAASRRDFAALSSETVAMLEAYAAGVNAYLGQADALPFEYSLTGGAPEPWEPWHSILVMRQRGYLMGSVWFKLWRAAAMRAIGPDNIAKLRYDDGGDDLLCIPPGAEAKRWLATLIDLKPAIDAVAALGPADANAGGSNNWAISPARTSTGRPIMAGDPHRQLELPSMYLQHHFACDAFDAVGLAVPGVPGFPHFGHNGFVAFGVTHAFADIHDLYVERFEAGGDRYLFRGELRPTTRRRETIAVRGGKPVDIDVVETHHGPVIAGEPRTGAALTLRSVQFAETDLSFDCLAPMLRARTVESFYEATRGWGLIDHNVVAADISGHIGHRVRAVVPRRPRLNGWLPVPGWTGDYEWNGSIPFEDMPCVIDPPRGFIVTANNRVVADGNGDYLMTDCHPPNRARRIEARLEALPQARPADMAAIHADDLSLPALAIRDRLARLTGTMGATGKLREAIVTWDGRMRADSHGAAAYAVFRHELTLLVLARSGLDATARDPLTRIPPGAVPLNQLWWAVPALLRDNDTALLGGTDWDAVLTEALTRAAATIDGRPWGELHAVKMVHPLANAFPAARATLEPKGLPIGGDNDTVFATGATYSAGLNAMSSAVARYVFDVGDWANSTWAVFHGVSGDPLSPHYADQHAMWAAAQMVPVLYDWPTIEAECKKEVLAPATVAPA